MNRLLIALVVSGCTGAATVSSGPPPANPQQPPPAVATPAPMPPAKHPAYLRALTDLRVARSYLARPAGAAVKWDENKAIREIDAAAIDDGKPLSDHPAVDAKLKHRDRLKQAMELLESAAKDIEEKEDNAFAKGLRSRAVGHLHNAEHAVREAIEERKDEKKAE